MPSFKRTVTARQRMRWSGLGDAAMLVALVRCGAAVASRHESRLHAEASDATGFVVYSLFLKIGRNALKAACCKLLVAVASGPFAPSSSSYNLYIANYLRSVTVPFKNC